MDCRKSGSTTVSAAVGISTIKTGWAGLQIGHLQGFCHLRRTITVPGTSSGASVGPLAGCMLRLAAVAFILSVCNHVFFQDSPSFRQQSPLKHLYGGKAGAPGQYYKSCSLSLQIWHHTGVRHLRSPSISTRTCPGPSAGRPAGSMLRLAARAFLLSG